MENSTLNENHLVVSTEALDISEFGWNIRNDHNLILKYELNSEQHRGTPMIIRSQYVPRHENRVEPTAEQL